MSWHTKDVTWEHETDSDQDVEIRIRFSASKCIPARGPSYASGGEPAEGGECEFDSAEVLGNQGKWITLYESDPGFIWAKAYFYDDAHYDRFCDAAEDEGSEYDHEREYDHAEALYDRQQDALMDRYDDDRHFDG